MQRGLAVMIGSLGVMILFALGPAQGDSADASDSDADRVCLMCHGEGSALPAHEILRSAHAGIGCAACHGPSQAHLGRNEDGTRPRTDVDYSSGAVPDAINSRCSSCHAAEVSPHWTGSAHQFERLACTDCHSLHASAGDPVLGSDSQAEVCFQCHQRSRSEFMLPHRHPVGFDGFSSDANLLACADCHDAHGSAAPADLKRMTLNETCYECHAELRGPFLWEHAPVREDCSSCHRPHGSVHDALLRQRPPQLCQQCHLAQFHPSTVRSGTGLPPDGADANLLGQSCMNCHTAVHGSNHPSSPGFTR